jgi:hypothetical protein
MSSHEEFPELTPEARAAFLVGCAAAPFPACRISRSDRRYLAAFLNEAMKCHRGVCLWDGLKEIADNLHSPPPTPPTLTQARAADMDTPEGKAVVRDFLATLGEGGQP